MRKKQLTTLIFIAIALFFLITQKLEEEKVSPVVVPAEKIVATESAIFASNSAVLGESGMTVADVTDVVDGDTIKVKLNGKIETIRYIGINTPETVDPRRGVQCFGTEASDENKRLVKGKKVILTKDISETDKYNRLLRYVYLPISENNTLFVNEHLVRQGFAEVYTYPPDVKFNEQFINAQREAERENRGLWAKCR